MEDYKKLEDELRTLKDRNIKVEAEKAWETSYFRRLTLALITYIVAAVVIHSLGVSNFFLHALVPTLGYLLSVQSLPLLKRWWIAKHLKK